MNTSVTGRIFRIAAVFTAASIMLTGCGETVDSAEQDYTVISGGTSAAATDTEFSGNANIYADVSDKELYVPKYMVTKYASLDYDFRFQDVYDDVVDTVTNFREKTLIPKSMTPDEYYRVLETVRCEQLMLFYLENRYSIASDDADKETEMHFDYKHSIREVNAMLMETEQAGGEVMALISEEMSDYEKLKIFHDYLVLNVETSTEDEYADSVYGALVKKKALCEGFAKAFSYLCNMAGIENVIVTGYTGVYHMWNMVKLDGKWYHVDVGWDKPPEALTEKYPDMVLYQYFLVDDEIMKNNRIISNMLFDPPLAQSRDYNYFYRENKYASSYDEVLKIVEQSCASCIDSGEKYFMLKLDSSNLFLQTAAGLMKPDENGVSDIDRIVEKLNFTGQISYIDYYSDNRIIIFILE